MIFTRGHWQLQDLRRRVADVEGALAAVPDENAPVVVPVHSAVVRLEIALVYGGGLELALHDDVRLRKALLRVPQPVLKVLRYVADPTRLLAELLGLDVVVKQRGRLLHRLPNVRHRRKYLVVDLDELGRLLRHVLIDRGYRGYRLAPEDDLRPGHEPLAEILQVGPQLTQGDLAVPIFVIGPGQVHARHDCADARVCGRLARVDRSDVGVGVRGPQYLPV